jgi:hypothetical protein
VPFTPTVKLPTWLFESVRSGARIVVTKLELLSAAFGSKTPDGEVTVAVFVIAPAPVAVPATVNVTEPPAGRVVIVLATLFPAMFTAPQTAPPVGEPQLAVSPLTCEGTASLNAAPLAASGPAFVTTML